MCGASVPDLPEAAGTRLEAVSADKTSAEPTETTPGDDQPTTVIPAAAEAPPAAPSETPATTSEAPPETPSEAPSDAPPAEAVPAEEPPADQGPGFRERARMRRRLRYLRRLRELLFRDLGGLTFDLHRFERDRRDLVDEKLAALTAIDGELRALETALDDRRELHELREAGISACPRCGTLHDTDANFCPACGTSLHGKAPAPPVSEIGTEVEAAPDARDQPTAS